MVRLRSGRICLRLGNRVGDFRRIVTHQEVLEDFRDLAVPETLDAGALVARTHAERSCRPPHPTETTAFARSRMAGRTESAATRNSLASLKADSGNVLTAPR